MHWTQNLCRICGQISECCHSIYADDVPTILEEKIKKCLNLNLCKADYKPKQICNCCVLKLNQFCEFIDTCYSTNQKFESIYFNSQTWPNKIEYPSQKQSVIVSNKQVLDSIEFDLYKNPEVTLDNFNITSCQVNDADVLEIVGNGNYDSHNCDRYESDKKVKSHFTTVLRHPVNPTEYSATSNFCQENQNVANSKICYIKYNQSFNPNNSSTTELVGPQDTSKNFEKKTVTVDQVKNSLEQSSQPWQKEKLKKRHPCPHCKKVFSRRGTLNSHIAYHTNIRPYTCDDCSKSFAVKSELTTHKKVHGDKHKCTFCPKKFSVPSKLERHVRIHTNSKPFVCGFDGCGKAFSDKRNLQGHKLMHLTEKNYPCPVCMKSFKTVNRLKQHSKCHTSGTMYTCNLCSKRYKYKSNLISHIKKHNNVCLFCKLNCESNTLLMHHLKTCKAHL